MTPSTKKRNFLFNNFSSILRQIALLLLGSSKILDSTSKLYPFVKKKLLRPQVPKIKIFLIQNFSSTLGSLKILYSFVELHPLINKKNCLITSIKNRIFLKFHLFLLLLNSSKILCLLNFNPLDKNTTLTNVFKNRHFSSSIFIFTTNRIISITS